MPELYKCICYILLTIPQVYDVGLKGPTYSVADLLATQMTDPLPMSEVTKSSTPLIVWREHAAEAPLRHFMSEVGPYREDIIVNADNGYYIVEPDMSVIFLSKPKSPGMCFIFATSIS